MTKHTVAVFRGEALVHLLELTGQDVRIGRSPENELCLRDDGKAVSRFHAELRADESESGYVVLDLNSQNGTWVDGERIARTPLDSGHDVVIGPYRLVIREGEFAEGELPPLTKPAASAVRASSSNAIAVATQPVAQRQMNTSPTRPAIPAAKPGAAQTTGGQSPVVIYAGIAVLVVLAVVVAVAMWLRAPARPAAASVVESVAPTPAPTPVSEPPPVAPMAPPVEPPPAPVQAASADPPPPTVPPVAATEPPARPRATPKKPEPVDPNALPRQEGESDADWKSRNAAAASAYQRALDRLSQRDWADAVKEWSALAEQYPGYRDTAARLEEARSGMQAAGRAALEAGNGLLATDMPAALREFERAAQYGASEAADLVAGTRERMRVEGLAAFKTARQYDAAKRVAEAIALYERAVRFLPSGDADRQAAEDRLRRLRQ
jgi:predicted component of type VI protein secretion system